MKAIHNRKINFCLNTSFQKTACRFTLIELLAVIAVIGILTAMLLPSLNKARNYAKTLTCMANEKNIALAYLAYADDYNGFIFYWGPYNHALGLYGVQIGVGDKGGGLGGGIAQWLTENYTSFPYTLKSGKINPVWLCPSTYGSGISYAANATDVQYSPRSIYLVKSPSKMMLVAEGYNTQSLTRGSRMITGMMFAHGDRNFAKTKQETAHASWYAGGDSNINNVTFADGHQESRMARNIPSYWSYNTLFFNVDTFFWNGENKVTNNAYSNM